MTWQVQEAKQRFSEVVRRAQNEGPQFVTRHGQEIAVVVAVDDYRAAVGTIPDFKEFLLSAPDVEQLDIVRSSEPARTVDVDTLG